jgi:ABC-type Fe3+-hydroxamate transport system substrate-binding protein
MPVFTDQMQREVELSSTPHRIISLVPSQTELLHDLGLHEQVIGITKFCIHPEEWFQIKTRVGGTKKLDIELIKSLNPDLIIGNKEENEHSQIDELAKHFPVWMSDVKSLDDAFEMISEIGRMTKKETKALLVSDGIQRAFSSFKIRIPEVKLGSVAYFIWKEPMMVAGGDTFISDMLAKCMLENVFQHLDRYPEIKPSELAAANPDYIFLASEPYPFKEKHIAGFQSICPETKIVLADGEMFSWYGSRLLKAPGYFKQLYDKIRGSD